MKHIPEMLLICSSPCRTKFSLGLGPVLFFSLSVLNNKVYQLAVAGAIGCTTLQGTWFTCVCAPCSRNARTYLIPRLRVIPCGCTTFSVFSRFSNRLRRVDIRLVRPGNCQTLIPWHFIRCNNRVLSAVSILSAAR